MKRILDNNTSYEVRCKNCRSIFKLDGIPSPKALKVLGDSMRCPSCGAKFHILENIMK